MRAYPPYCGSPPVPGELLTRFNLDPVLILALVTLVIVHVRYLYRRRAADPTRPDCSLRYAIAGWLVVTAALLSPLCALSVSLFSARVGQHMILILIAAPLLACALPPDGRSARDGTLTSWITAAAFCVALWFWHMPAPYEATFSSTFVYWSMYFTLFGSAVLLWRALLQHAPARTANVLAIGILTSMQMGLLGAILTFATRPFYYWHLLSLTERWGLTPLQDQQLGGVFMWVPGVGLFLWAAIRSLGKLWRALEGEVNAT